MKSVYVIVLDSWRAVPVQTAPAASSQSGKYTASALVSCGRTVPTAYACMHACTRRPFLIICMEHDNALNISRREKKGEISYYRF